MPSKLQPGDLEAAEAAVTFAQLVRKAHRRRTTKVSTQRNADIEMALQRLREAMAPIKSDIGAHPYGPTTAAAQESRQRVRAMSEAIQRERRKLWKMRGKKNDD